MRKKRVMNKELTDEDIEGEGNDKDELEREMAKPTGNAEKIVKGKGKKRKHAKAEVMEDIMTKAMKTVTDGLKESEKMYVELEEKHMEFEERKKQKDREFQKEMMKMLVSRCLPLTLPNILCTNRSPRNQYISILVMGCYSCEHIMNH